MPLFDTYLPIPNKSYLQSLYSDSLHFKDNDRRQELRTGNSTPRIDADRGFPPARDPGAPTPGDVLCTVNAGKPIAASVQLSFPEAASRDVGRSGERLPTDRKLVRGT
jgi:hypothetical protein